MYYDDSAVIRLRRMRRWTIFCVSAYFPLGFVIFFFFIREPEIGTPWLVAILALTLASVLRLRLLKCPGCGQLFYADNTWGATNWRIPFARNCMHCNFSLAENANTYANPARL